MAYLLGALALLWIAALLLGGSGSAFDPPLLAALYAEDEPGLAAAAALLTQLGGWIALTLAALTAAALLFYRRRPRDAALLLLIALGGRLLVEAQKLVSARARPEEEHLVLVQSLSFPSAHAANSVTTYLAVALLLSGRPWAIAAALLLSLAISLTRPMLGVHWPSDVVGGWAFGLFWTLAILHRAGALKMRRSPLRNPRAEGDGKA